MLNSQPEEFKYIYEFYPVMLEALRRDNAEFATELFRHGLRISSFYALEAVRLKAKKVIAALIDNGWDINEPLSEIQPPVLA